MTRLCKTCNIKKSIEDFYPKKGNYYTHSCKICLSKKQKTYKTVPCIYNREKVFKEKYNLSIEEYDKLLLEQNYKCAICRTPQSDLKRSLAVDHCHKTGKVRGLLCTSCNIGLGNFKDNVSNVEDALFYLILHK